MSAPLRKTTQVADGVNAIFTWACFKKKKTSPESFYHAPPALSSAREAPLTSNPSTLEQGLIQALLKQPHSQADRSILELLLSILSILGSFLHHPPTLGTIAILPLVSTASPCQLKALPSSPFLLPHSTTCPLSPDGFQLSFQSTCTGKPCLLLSRGGGALDGVLLLGDLFISPPIVIFPCSAC